jgi:lipocalin
MKEARKSINGAGIYDENAKNSRLKLKFINPLLSRVKKSFKINENKN